MYGTLSVERELNDISANCKQFVEKVSQLKRALPRIGSASDSPDFRAGFRESIHEANSMAEATYRKLEAISKKERRPDEETRFRKVQDSFTSLLNDVKSVSKEFIRIEKQDVDRLRARSTSTDQDPFRLDPPGYEQATITGTEQTAIQTQADLEELRAREEALRSLEGDIVQINDMFKDIAVLIHEQGETIDSIEANVDRTTGHVATANTELRRAKDYQKKARKKKCCLIGIGVVILIIIILAIAIPLATQNDNKS